MRRFRGYFAHLLAAGPAEAQRIELMDDAQLPRFEVASVRRGDPNAPPGRVDFPPGRFVQLEPAKTSVDYLVIDHFENPDPN